MVFILQRGKKMKKILMLSILLLSACQGSTISSTIDSIESSTISNEVVSSSTISYADDSPYFVYLCLTKIGLYNNVKGTTIPDLHLENTIKYESELANLLPGKSVITSTVANVEFVSWIHYVSGVPESVGVMPNQRGLILTAQWSYNGTIIPPTPAYGWYIVGEGSFINGEQTWSTSTGILMTVNSDYQGEGVEYLAINIHFNANDVFKLTDGTDWISSGWQTDPGSALQTGAMSLVNDGSGGNNVKVVTTGYYDIYFKVFPNQTYSCWIAAHP
jgi:hypothetical protein